jgi:hypothetical protein
MSGAIPTSTLPVCLYMAFTAATLPFTLHMTFISDVQSHCKFLKVIIVGFNPVCLFVFSATAPSWPRRPQSRGL